MCVCTHAGIQQRGKKNKWLVRAAVIEEELLENNGTATAAVPRDPLRPSVCPSWRLSVVYYNTFIHIIKHINAVEEKGKHMVSSVYVNLMFYANLSYMTFCGLCEGFLWNLDRNQRA